MSELEGFYDDQHRQVRVVYECGRLVASRHRLLLDRDWLPEKWQRPWGEYADLASAKVNEVVTFTARLKDELPEGYVAGIAGCPMPNIEPETGAT